LVQFCIVSAITKKYWANICIDLVVGHNVERGEAWYQIDKEYKELEEENDMTRDDK
jgi:hypothetical protein